MVFATAMKMAAKKLKPKMEPISLNTSPEQTQTITRTLFDIVKEHGPLSIADIWTRVQMYSGGWVEGSDRQNAYENHTEMDEGETEIEANVQPCWPSQKQPFYHILKCITSSSFKFNIDMFTMCRLRISKMQGTSEEY